MSQLKIFLITMLIFGSVNGFAQSGISTEIDESKISDLIDRISNSKFELDMGIKLISSYPASSQEAEYRKLIQIVLQTSKSKPNEFLMNNLLLRVQVLDRVLQQTPSSRKRNDLARKVLSDGVHWAYRLYDADTSLLRKTHQHNIPPHIRGVSFARLGLEWAQYTLSLSKDIPSSEARLQVAKDLMGLIFNDINNDDAVRRILAPVLGNIVRKHNEVKNIQLKSKRDIEALSESLILFIRQQIDAAKNLLKDHPNIFSEYQEGTLSSPSKVFNRGDIVSHSAYITKIMYPNHTCAGEKYYSLLFYDEITNATMVVLNSDPTTLSYNDKSTDFYQVRVLTNGVKGDTYTNAVVGCEGFIPSQYLVSTNQSVRNPKPATEISLLNFNVGDTLYPLAGYEQNHIIDPEVTEEKHSKVLEAYASRLANINHNKNKVPAYQFYSETINTTIDIHNIAIIYSKSSSACTKNNFCVGESVLLKPIENSNNSLAYMHKKPTPATILAVNSLNQVIVSVSYMANGYYLRYYVMVNVSDNNLLKINSRGK